MGENVSPDDKPKEHAEPERVQNKNILHMVTRVFLRSLLQQLPEPWLSIHHPLAYQWWQWQCHTPRTPPLQIQVAVGRPPTLAAEKPPLHAPGGGRRDCLTFVKPCL